jgi:alanyl-tRNA synthetase
MHPQTINERFVDYYQSLGFKYLPGTSLLHPSIPMTFVMSAGLAEVETALAQAGGRSPENDYVLVQNCFRHFDVDRIGHSDLHLSLFQMPGAFSFGHNCCRTTTKRMWSLLTDELGIDPDRLWATYFAGGEVAGHHFDADLDTRQTWWDIGLPEDRVIGLGVDHNFWKQGGGIDGKATSRKCGPNTEVFFNRGSELACGPDCQPGCQCGRFVEFANSLFIFAKIDAETGALSLMAEPFTETVIGTERVAMIVENKPTIFEIETVKPIVECLRTFYAFTQKEDTSFDAAQSERILVDHLRALVYLTADGAPPPGKGGRRRLMRILIRRALAQMKVLDVDPACCLPVLLSQVVALAGNRHPDLEDGRNGLLAYMENERRVFEHTLSRGYRQLDRLLARNNGATLAGGELVSLVKQFGIPVSLLKVTMARRGIEFKEHEYWRAVEQWRRKVPASSVMSR